MLYCKFCNKECKNDNSLRNHERLCKENPDRQISWLEKNRKFTSNSNQYIKAKENGEVKEVSKETREKISESNKSRSKEWNKENGKKISEAIQKKVKDGEWHTSLAKNMHYQYNGINLHGKWEVSFAKYLDSNDIKWSRPKTRFEYLFEGKIRYYTPDFYLIESDEYVEIKGYKTKKDEAKWTQFNYHNPLVIYLENDLKELKII